MLPNQPTNVNGTSGLKKRMKKTSEREVLVTFFGKKVTLRNINIRKVEDPLTSLCSEG